MAHRSITTQQRSSAQPPPPALDPNGKNNHHQPAARKPLDPTTISTSKPTIITSTHLSRFRHPNKKPVNNNSPPVKDVHLQAKSLTLSAIHDSSKFSNSFLKPNPKTAPPKKSSSSSSSSSYSKELQKKKFYQFIVSDKEEAQDKECKKKVDKQEKAEEVDRLDLRKLSVSLDFRGGRRSFGGCQVELGDVFANNGVRVVSADMPPFMQIHVVDFARKTHDSMEKFTSKALALSLKKEFDGVYGPAWHCIVGKNFGSFVTHLVGGFLYFSMDQKLYILLFKTAVQRAD